MKITQKTFLSKILEQKGAEEILAKYGVPCVSCPFAKFEMDKLEIGQICKMYGLNSQKLLEDLNNGEKNSKN